MHRIEVVIQRVFEFSDHCAPLKRAFKFLCIMAHHVSLHSLLRFPFLRAFGTWNDVFPPFVYIKTVPIDVTFCFEGLVTLVTWVDIVL